MSSTVLIGIIKSLDFWAVLLSESIVFIIGISLLLYIHRRVLGQNPRKESVLYRLKSSSR